MKNSVIIPKNWNLYILKYFMLLKGAYEKPILLPKLFVITPLSMRGITEERRIKILTSASRRMTEQAV